MKEASDHLMKGLKILGGLEPEERLGVYQTIRKKGGLSFIPNAPGVLSRDVSSEELRLNMQGYVEVIKRSIEDTQSSTPSVFLSHSHADKRKVRWIADKLTNAGIRVWIDEAEINHGDSLIEKLSSALNSVDLVLAFLSESSIESEWVKKELEIAMNHEIKRRRVTTVPVLLDPVALPQFLYGKLYADFTTAHRKRTGLPKLIESIYDHKNTNG